MARMIDLVTPASRSTSYASSSTSPTRQRPPLLPLVITCDPARDTPSVLKNYLAEFHPAMLGLTGTWEQIKQVCKAYRVYFSTPEGVKPGMDYLVDHSIYFYLMGAFPFILPF
jgi:protein SCO1/2